MGKYSDNDGQIFALYVPLLIKIYGLTTLEDAKRTNGQTNKAVPYFDMF